MVRAYLSASGSYRADAVLSSTFRAAGEPAAGAEWLIDLARAAPNQTDLLSMIAEASRLPAAQRDRFYARLVTISEEAVAREHGDAQDRAQNALDACGFAGFARSSRRKSRRVPTRCCGRCRTRCESYASELTAIETRVAAANGMLDELLERYVRDTERAVNLDVLRDTAGDLRASGNVTAAQRVLEFVYQRQIESAEAIPTAYLGLAELRIDQGNAVAALDLLRRLTLIVGEPFEHLAACGDLLQRKGHPKEALEFRRARVKAVPWDAEAQVALARTEVAAKEGQGEAARVPREWLIRLRCRTRCERMRRARLREAGSVHASRTYAADRAGSARARRRA